MGVSRAALSRSTAYVAYNGVFFETKDDINIRHMPTWESVMTSMFGRVDSFKKDCVIKIPLRLWGAYENLSTLFPSYAMNPTPGTSVYGTSDVPLVVQARNNDRITYANTQLTKLVNLYLGVDSDLFAADVEFTALIANNTNPEASGAYHTRDTNAYSDATAAFAKTNYKRTRFTGAWGAITGFTALVPQKGVSISWELNLRPVPVDGYGTVDMTVIDMVAQARMIPIGPTLAQLKTNSQEESAMGTLGSTISADLVLTGANSGPVITLKSAFLKENGLVFGQEPLRVGEALWESTRGFTTGAPNAVGIAA